MAIKIFHTFLHLMLFIFSVLFLRLQITTSTSTSASDRLIAATTHYKCIDKERDALLNFKVHVQDPLDLLSAWTSKNEEDGECCKWNGVTCNNHTGHVIELYLPNHSMKGSLGGKISPSLLNLTYLSYLNLFANSFTGTIPMFISSMTQLSNLDLSFNYFSGTIPASIGSLTELKSLKLGGNSFSGSIPTSIGSLTKLTYLDLSENHLLNGTCIPSELGNLTNLQELSLGELTSCTVETIDWLYPMSELNELDMEDTSLAKDAIVSLKKLSLLYFSGCDLSRVMHPYSSSFVNSSSSSSIVGLYLDENNLNSSMYHWLLPLTSNKLRDLSLSKNMLDGNGKSLGYLCSVKYLDFSYNSATVKFHDFLNNWSRCTSVELQSLYAPYNKFTGSLPDEVQMFPSLDYLALNHNELNGSISEKVWELPKLETLDISSNFFGDNIFENTSKSKIRYINLSNNSLKGVTSEGHLSNLSYVVSIDLSSCNLGPRFPNWIQNFKNLTELKIANNKIFDAIPVEFWKIWSSQLTYLNLSTNNISGEVPDLLPSFDPNFSSKIDLSSNNFYGHIPSVPYTSAHLDLSRNQFNGGISFLCKISNGVLTYLDLSHNSFTGQLPNCLWHFKELGVLNLGYNNLSGRLPPSVAFLIELEMLSLYNNNFFGELPLSLKNCTKLTFLDLGANKFTGNVPRWIGDNLSRLYVLSLTSNKLRGPIPLQLCQLANLQILDLSTNNLNGTIPSCVNNLTTMANYLTTMIQEGFLHQQSVHIISDGTSSGSQITNPQSIYVDHKMIHWQGYPREFSTNLGLFKGIDLSSNNLTGQIPYELMELHGLLALNLSNNALLGKIPWNIGNMRNILALDLSRNNLSGEIPSSISKMNSLDYLDVSYNNLLGRIPSSTQLQSFEPSRYAGNARLCGLPLTKYCPGDKQSEVPPLVVVGENEDDKKEIYELWRWFYIGSATGFIIGFCIVCGTLLLNHRARKAFFHFQDSLQNMVYVEVVVFIAKLKRFVGN